MSEIKNENIIETSMDNLEPDLIQQQIIDLKLKLKDAKKRKKLEIKPIKEVIVKVKKEPIDKKTYMREYMREYSKKNKAVELARRNTCYYMKKYNIPEEFKSHFGLYTADCWKAIETMKKVKTNCPNLYPDIFKYI